MQERLPTLKVARKSKLNFVIFQRTLQLIKIVVCSNFISRLVHWRQKIVYTGRVNSCKSRARGGAFRKPPYKISGTFSSPQKIITAKHSIFKMFLFHGLLNKTNSKNYLLVDYFLFSLYFDVICTSIAEQTTAK